MLLLNWWVICFLLAFAILFSIFFLWPFLFGAPFEPTSEKKIKKMIKLARVKKGDKAVDLGSGDGRIVIALARAGAEAHGYEINPFLVLISKYRIKKAGLKGKAFIHWKSFWSVDFRKYNIVMLFQFRTIMHRLEKKLRKELKSNSRVVSYYWKFPKWKPIKKIENIYLYRK